MNAIAAGRQTVKTSSSRTELNRCTTSCRNTMKQKQKLTIVIRRRRDNVNQDYVTTDERPDSISRVFRPRLDRMYSVLRYYNTWPFRVLLSFRFTTFTTTTTTNSGCSGVLVEYRTRNREVAGSTHTRSTASNLKQIGNLLCAQANSASYHQRDGR